MATFPSIDCSFGVSKSSEPVLRRTRFNDGYEQRISFGIHQNPKKWSLSWQNITEADSDTIETFLDARGADGASFDWTPPNEPTSYKFICGAWDKQMNYAGRATISAEFQQVFEP
tara:strand:- start:561 stop:905 length:345 start_codon:yes stop_codon:yes gene_type:complete